jgi:uncharacterized protein YciI
VELESFAFVLLRSGPNANAFSPAELEHYQAAHLAHLEAMTKAGKLAGAGPFSDQPDESLRGLCIFATSLEETRALMADDPSVRAGRMAPEIMRWLTHRGSLPGSESS